MLSPGTAKATATVKATSAQQRQANRRNALRSTGPKSLAGKRRASTNARLHGLAGAGELSTVDPLLGQLSSLVAQDGMDPVRAQEIALKIISYERNQAYQRELFWQAQAPNHSGGEVHQEMRNSFGAELDMMADVLAEHEHWREHQQKYQPDGQQDGQQDSQQEDQHDHQQEEQQEDQHEHQHEHHDEHLKDQLNKEDLDFMMNMQRRMLSIVAEGKRERERRQRVRHAIRYLKRSSNQLIGSIKRLRGS